VTAPLRILILGGTGFLGPHFVEAARSRGHVLTLFNRGRRAPDLFPGVETLQGDRDGGLDSLRHGSWDAVVDNCGYVPRIVRQSAELLASRVGRCVFVSSISVYADMSEPGRDETADVLRLPEDERESEEIGKHYGALKALCEEAVEDAMPGRVARIRPGLIVGPGDPTDRFTYWPARLARGGEILAPGDGSDPVQVIDVRDLAEWMIHAVETDLTGIFNATGPAHELTMREMLEACRVPGVDATTTWAPWPLLEKQDVAPWSDMPAWVPPVGEHAGLGATDCRRAIAQGLRFRPISETARDTLTWWQGARISSST
jgi:2'-hydroxyisoflavone reductase